MYLQIMDQIKHRIALGDWPVGEKLLSIPEPAIGLQGQCDHSEARLCGAWEGGRNNDATWQGTFIVTGPGLDEKIDRKALETHLQEAARLG